MATNVIDELSLKIDIDVDKGASKAITSIARAITKLNDAVKSSANLSKLRKYVSAINRLQPNKISVRNGTSVGKAMGKNVQPRFEEVSDKKSTSGELSKIATNGNNAAKAVQNVGKESKKTKQALKDVDKNADKTSNTFKKLVRSIGRIAFYRRAHLCS